LRDRELILGIRPEQIGLAPAGSADFSLAVDIEVVEPTGPDTLVVFTLNQVKACCRLAPDQAPRVGETLNLQFDPRRALLFDAQTGERLGVVQPEPVRESKVTRLVSNGAGTAQ
jgi:multiple sugar transport system ATP-binding protein